MTNRKSFSGSNIRGMLRRALFKGQNRKTSPQLADLNTIRRWRSDLEIKILRDAAEVNWPLPKFAGKRKAFIGSTLVGQFPPSAMISIAEGRAFAGTAIAIDRNNIGIVDTSWHDREAGRFFGSRNLRTRPEVVSGSVLSLISEYADSNYGHFLLDSLGRLAIVRDVGATPSDYDHVYLPGERTPWKERLAVRFGIRAEQCIWSGETPSIIADELFLTTFPGYRRNYPLWLCEFIKSHQTAGVNTSMKRRLFVMREGSSRGIANIGDVLAVMRQLGFEDYYPSRNEDPWKDFSEAEYVAGVHGAGLTDIVFCKPGTRIIEILPDDHCYPYFYSIAVACDLEQFFFVAEASGAKPVRFGPTNSDVIVDCQELFESIITLTEEARSDLPRIPRHGTE